MKNSVILCTILSLLLVFSSCTSEQYDDENDYMFEVLEDSGSVRITGYTMAKREIRIPPEIQGMPVTEIGEFAFEYKLLASVAIPDSVITIHPYAFASNRLTSVNIGSNVKTIGQSAFHENQITSLTIPDSVISIDTSAFADNRLTSLTIGSSVVTIGELAFADNRELASVTIPESVTLISWRAFAQNPLTSITIGADVEIFDIWFDPTFPNRFTDVYNAHGSQAGTYIFNDGVWGFRVYEK